MTKNRFKKRSPLNGIALLIITGMVLVFANIIIKDTTLRFDLTQNNVYSLSKATHKIIEKTQKEISLKFYGNASKLKDAPSEIKAYSKRVEDLLKEYKAAANNKINIEFIKPEVDSDEEDEAITYGLEGIDFPGGEKLFMGLAAISGEKEEIIPFLDPSKEERLEYEITRIISRLQSDKQPKLGILTSSNIFGVPGGYMQQPSPKWYFLDALSKQYKIEQLDPKIKELPGDLNALLLFQPKDIDESLAKGIEKYVENGGGIIVISDPLALLDPASRMEPYTFPMEETFKKWGVTFSTREAIVDIRSATRVMGRDNKPELNPGWLSIKEQGMNRKNIITSNLQSMLFPIAGSFTIVKKEALKHEVLIESTENSGVYDPSFLQFGGMEAIKNNFNPDKEKHPIAVKITGNFSGKKDKENGAVIFIADSDFLFDQFYMQKQNFLGFHMVDMFNDNLTFLLNSVEILCGEKELIDIRSTSKTMRPFVKVQELEEKAREKWLEKEKELAKRAKETSEQLQALENNKNSSQNLVLSPEQEKTIKEYRERKKEMNNQLKQVRRELRSEIEALGTKIKLINILLVPFIIAVIGIITGLRRKNN